MVITDIKIRKLFEDGPMKAIVSVTFDNQLALHDIKVIYAKEKFFIVMPSRKNPDGTYRDIAPVQHQCGIPHHAGTGSHLCLSCGKKRHLTMVQAPCVIVSRKTTRQPCEVHEKPLR